MKKLGGYLYLTCAFVLAGSSVISARLVSQRVGTFTITAVSLLLALLLLLPLSRNKLASAIRRMSLKDWAHAALQALFGIVVFRLLLLQGLLHTSTSEAGVLTGATPAVTAMLAWICLREPVRLKNVIGIVSTAAGIALIQGLLTQSFSAAHLAGNLLVLGAAVSESVFNVLSRKAAVRSDQDKAFDPLTQTTLVTAIALAFSLPLALTEQPAAALAGLDMAGWLALLWYGWFVTALAFICWYAGIKRCPANIAAAFTGLMPFTAMLLSATMLHEAIAWFQWAGAALVVLGMALIGLNSAPRRVPARAPAEPC